MSKASKKNAATKAPKSNSANVTPFPKPRHRLDGDELFAWATMQAEIRHQHEKINASAFVFLQNRKLDPAGYIIDEQGFIVRRTDYEATLKQATPQTQEPVPEGPEENTGE